ncbi:MAG: hypothetical protein ACXWJM_06365 [Ramlibacter sp.]
MQALRHATFLARLVLAWFALTLGVAIASPLVNPQAMELVCSGAGVLKLVVKADGGTAPASGHTLDCPLCASFSAPPAAAPAVTAMALPRGDFVAQTPASRTALRAAAPLPARGPPEFQLAL